MDRLLLSERDICTKFITPAILQAGWQQHQFREELKLTDGRVMVRGKLAARKSGMQKEVLHLEAMLHDDRGGAAQEAGDEATAVAEFKIALADAQKIGGTFRKDILYFANWICDNDPTEPLCR